MCVPPGHFFGLNLDPGALSALSSKLGEWFLFTKHSVGRALIENVPFSHSTLLLPGHFFGVFADPGPGGFRVLWNGLPEPARWGDAWWVFLLSRTEIENW